MVKQLFHEIPPKKIKEFTLGVSKKMQKEQVFRHIPSITSTCPERTEFGMLASLMLVRSMKLEDGIFLSLKGLAEGRPYFRNGVRSQPVSLCYSVSISFLASCVGRVQTDLKAFCLWVQTIVWTLSMGDSFLTFFSEFVIKSRNFFINIFS